MEKDVDRIGKNPDTDIVIRIDDFGGKRGLTIREFVRSERYTGFTKAGTRIPAEKFKLFKEAINSIDEKDFEIAEQEKFDNAKPVKKKSSGQNREVSKKEDASTQPTFSKQVGKEDDDDSEEIEEQAM